MSVVRNKKRRTDDFCDGAPKGRGRCANTARSRYVLMLLMGACLASNFTIGVPRCSPNNVDRAIVICQEPSVSRASGADAKLQDPADASLTIWWRPFYQA
jgi:hypothetical protein